MAIFDPAENFVAGSIHMVEQIGTGYAQDELRRYQESGSDHPHQEGRARVWLSKIKRHASKVTKKKWGSSTSSKKSSRSKRSIDTFTSPLGPPTQYPINQSPITPHSTPVDPLTALALPPPIVPLPVVPHIAPLPPPSATPISPLSITIESKSLPPSRRRSQAALILCDMCMEFLQIDDRPTAILEIRRIVPQAFEETADNVKVTTLFTNPAFEHLKPQLKLNFKSSTAMGGILRQIDTKVEWVVPNGDWRLRCITIGGSKANIAPNTPQPARADQWLKVMTANPVLHLEEKVCAGIIPNDDDVQRHLDGVGPVKSTPAPEVRLENYRGGGDGDVRRISIAEEPSQELLKTAGPIEHGGDGEETSFSSKTITPSQTRGTNTTRGSIDASSCVTSRRSSRSLPTGKSSAIDGVLESLGARSESISEERLTTRPNMDWTRGAMLRKNTQNLAGMDEHLNFLMHAPWDESPIGPPLTWPISLRCIANVVMSFPHPAMVYWSEDLIAIYNPQAKIMAGDNHPEALGQPFEQGFPNFKEYMLPYLQKALEGKTTLRTNELLFLNIEIPHEESYYNFIISPIIGASGIAEGVLKQAHSRTSQVIQARRMETLHKIREQVELIRDLDRDDFWKHLLDGLGANEVDSPFALIYKVTSESTSVLAGTLGIPAKVLLEGDLVPPKVRVGGKTASSSGKGPYTGPPSRNDVLMDTYRQQAEDSGHMTPVDGDTTSSSSGITDPEDHFLFSQEMLRAQHTNAVAVKDLTTVSPEYKQKLTEIEYRGFGDPCTHAVVIPIQPSPSMTFGYLILGLNPRRPYNNEYLMWLNMLMEQLSTSIGRVRLLTEDLRRAVQEARHQKQLASQALERKRQQENFIDISSHELRNPLSAVLQSAEGIIGLLSKAKNGRAKSIDFDMIADSAQTILLCVNHQRLIIEDILAVGKLDSNLMTVSPVASDPKELIWNGLKMFEAELASKGIDWEFRVLESYDLLEVGWVNIDPSRTTQILVNLVANAIKFTALKEGKKKISILVDASLESPTNWSNFDYLPSEKLEEDITEREDWGTGEPIFLSVAVKDTGIGISKTNKRNLFQRFNQVPKTHITYGGSGLGLYISRRLCQLQGGNIGVSSVEGEGSTFRFYVKARRTAKPETPHTSVGSAGSLKESREIKRLTAATQAHGQPRSNSNATTPKSTKSTLYYVLVVEDNLINQKVLKQQLIAEGCTVYTANNGQEALDKIMQSRFAKADGNHLDVVLMDMEMPVMGGVEATQKIRKLERERRSLHVPIIGISANARPEQMNEMRQAGMDDAIPKPFRISDLLRMFRVLIDRPQ